MNEARRQFAMGVAGVRLWYARGSLPGAAPSPDFDFGEPPGPAEVLTESANRPLGPSSPHPASETSRKGLARLQGLLSETRTGSGSGTRGGGVVASSPPAGVAETTSPRESPGAGPPTDAEPEQVPIEPTASALAGKAIGFQWRFWLGEQWLLVSSCPDAASRGLEDRLAANILRALGDVVTRTEALRWPVFSNPAVPGNDAEGAVEVVTAMAKAVSRPRRLWLGLEPDDSDAGSSTLWRQVSAPLGEATVSFPGSLVALSSDPGAKRALWQALKQAGRS